MRKTAHAALLAVLLASASSAALAQDVTVINATGSVDSAQERAQEVAEATPVAPGDTSAPAIVGAPDSQDEQSVDDSSETAAADPGTPAPIPHWLKAFNRVNYKADVFLRPAVEHVLNAYHIIPEFVRNRIGDLIEEAFNEPINFVESLLQLKVHEAGGTAIRFGVNAFTAGLFDIATELGYPEQDEDGGLTLRHYGWKSCIPVYVVLLGPNSVSDLIGKGADSIVTPWGYIHFHGSSLVFYVHNLAAFLDQGGKELPQLWGIERTSVDAEATAEYLYCASRNAESNGGTAPATNLPKM